MIQKLIRIKYDFGDPNQIYQLQIQNMICLKERTQPY